MRDVILGLNIALDQFDMKGAIAGFPDQIKQSFSIMERWTPHKEYTDISDGGVSFSDHTKLLNTGHKDKIRDS